MLKMVWDHKNKLIFVHIPKTGGTSIEKAMGINTDNNNLNNGYGIKNDKARQHYIWSDYIDELGIDKYTEYEKFSLIRNPYSKFMSEYFWSEIPKVGFKSGQTLDEFIISSEQIVNNNEFNKSVYHDHIMPQYMFVYDNNDKLMIDIVFKFEHMIMVEEYLKQKLLINCLPHVNKNDKVKKPLQLTPEQKEKIYKIYEKDFKLFGYIK